MMQMVLAGPVALRLGLAGLSPRARLLPLILCGALAVSPSRSPAGAPPEPATSAALLSHARSTRNVLQETQVLARAPALRQMLSGCIRPGVLAREGPRQSTDMPAAALRAPGGA